MNKYLNIYIAAVIVLMASGCGENPVDFGCTKESSHCDSDKQNYYVCESDDDGHSYWIKNKCDFTCDDNRGCVDCTNGETKCAETDVGAKYFVCEDYKWNSKDYCAIGCNEDGKSCKQRNDCNEVNNLTGACVCNNGNNEDGSCVCPDYCVIGCDSNNQSGECLSRKDCDLINKTTGACLCQNGNEIDGTCTCPKTCVIGCNSDGSCKLQDCGMVDETAVPVDIETGACICKNENDEKGKCLCPETCVIGCYDDGSCKMQDCGMVNGVPVPVDSETGACVCKNGTDEKGKCFHPDTCVIGSNDDGSCISRDDCAIVDGERKIDFDTGACMNCQNGNINDPTSDANGSCICPNDCVIGCDKPQGNDGTCAPRTDCYDVDEKTGGCICENGNNDDGSCICPQCDAESGSECNLKNGTCSCSVACPAGCLKNGVCRSANSCESDGECNNYTYCQTDLCYCNMNSDGGKKKNTCVLRDLNNNHMDDRFESKDLTWNNDNCSKANCDKNDEKYEDCINNVVDCSKKYDQTSFCDSFIGYKCSTKCTDTTQCMPGFICRKDTDGRCSADSFTTVWDKGLAGQSLYLESLSYDIYVCRNWKEGGKNISEYSKFKDIKPEVYEKFPELKNATCPIEFSHYECSKNCQTINLAPPKINNSESSFVIKIYGELNGATFKYNAEPERDYSKYLLQIQSFGRADFNGDAFAGCYNLTKLPSIDIPDSGKLTTMYGMFSDCCSLNSPMENWDVSNVTDMQNVFWMRHCAPNSDSEKKNYNKRPVFNQPLNKWDVSNVELMSNMFGSLPSFNQPLDNWDVSKVKDMRGLFGCASSSLYSSFNQDISGWDVSNVKVSGGKSGFMDMFKNAEYFSQNLEKWKMNGGISGVSNIKDLGTVFAGSGMYIFEQNSSFSCPAKTDPCYGSDSDSECNDDSHRSLCSQIIAHPTDVLCNIIKKWPVTLNNYRSLDEVNGAKVAIWHVNSECYQ